jgi:hypothetical protein
MSAASHRRQRSRFEGSHHDQTGQAGQGAYARSGSHPTGPIFTSAEIGNLVDDLARNAEAVCRHYLSNGRRQGGYWIVGDLGNNPGRSLYVRLRISAKGAAGKFNDAATGEHGDLLDIIRETRGLRTFPEAVAEARRFLGQPDQARPCRTRRASPVRCASTSLEFAQHSAAALPAMSSTSEAARRLFGASQPITGTLAELYLHRRGIIDHTDTDVLRFHPSCRYRLDEEEHRPHPADDADGQDPSPNPHYRLLPALIAAVTDDAGIITGVQRTYLDAEMLDSDAPFADRLGKALFSSPRRALGDLLGQGVRFGPPESAATDTSVMAAGEGIETMLSLRMILPALPMIAALSASHLAALQFPLGLRRLYIAQDADPAGRHASRKLRDRAETAGIEAIVLMPMLDDLNGDLRRFGTESMRHHLGQQLRLEDIKRFLMTLG